MTVAAPATDVATRLSVDRLCKHFGGVAALTGVDFTLHAGDRVQHDGIESTLPALDRGLAIAAHVQQRTRILLCLQRFLHGRCLPVESAGPLSRSNVPIQRFEQLTGAALRDRNGSDHRDAEFRGQSPCIDS